VRFAYFLLKKSGSCHLPEIQFQNLFRKPLSFLSPLFLLCLIKAKKQGLKITKTRNVTALFVKKISQAS
jgi:hypothetical protein